MAKPFLPAPEQATGPNRKYSQAIYRVSSGGVKPFRRISHKILKNLGIKSCFQHNFADMAAAFHMPVALGGLGQGQSQVDNRFYRPPV